ncbi:MAG: hypothetical protein IMW94_10395 [Thermoanaerobacter sp.]|nr:hypothetical protein [Thermoanaerobacter sp.]
MYNISAKGICSICFEPVWPEESSVREGGRVYHAECHRRIAERVEQLTRYARKTRRRKVICDVSRDGVFGELRKLLKSDRIRFGIKYAAGKRTSTISCSGILMTLKKQ